MRITTIEVHQLDAPRPDTLAAPQQRAGRMSDWYDQPSAGARPSPLRRLYLRLGTDSDIAGLYGPIDQSAVGVIRHNLAAVVLGSDPLAINLLHERMLRSNRHIRTGQGAIGRSAIDNAVWDIRGRVFDMPVYQLLGGATRQRVPAYASTLGCSHSDVDVRKRSRALAAEYPAQKWFFRHSAVQPGRALTAAVELAETLRSSVGPDYPLMFDAVMSWDLDLARTWAQRTSGTEPAWLEEPFPAYDEASYRLLGASTPVPLAFGEHLYNRWEATSWIESRILRYLQCDPEWCGGTSELIRIASLCSAAGVRLVPHGHNLHAALHVVASQPPWVSPYVEYLTEFAEERHYFEHSPPVPDKGSFALPSRPGFGIQLARDRATSNEILWQANVT